uniref:Uncharacterized protein n=1 Tax=Clastoptera arizonana TaxID=38151 RepID=A0A1B6D6Z9_9HEMI
MKVSITNINGIMVVKVIQKIVPFVCILVMSISAKRRARKRFDVGLLVNANNITIDAFELGGHLRDMFEDVDKNYRHSYRLYKDEIKRNILVFVEAIRKLDEIHFDKDRQDYKVVKDVLDALVDLKDIGEEAAEIEILKVRRLIENVQTMRLALVCITSLPEYNS